MCAMEKLIFIHFIIQYKVTTCDLTLIVIRVETTKNYYSSFSHVIRAKISDWCLSLSQHSELSSLRFQFPTSIKHQFVARKHGFVRSEIISMRNDNIFLWFLTCNCRVAHVRRRGFIFLFISILFHERVRVPEFRCNKTRFHITSIKHAMRSSNNFCFLIFYYSVRIIAHNKIGDSP